MLHRGQASHRGRDCLLWCLSSPVCLAQGPRRAESKWKLLLLLCCQHPSPTGCLDRLGGQRGVGRWGMGICFWGWAGLCTGEEAGTGWAAAEAQGRGRCHPPPWAPGLEAEPWAAGACSPPPRLTDGIWQCPRCSQHWQPQPASWAWSPGELQASGHAHHRAGHAAPWGFPPGALL